MSTFEELIKHPEPKSVDAIHKAKILLAVAGIVSLPVAVGTTIFAGESAWLLVPVVLLAGAYCVALVANRLSESHFARRAKAMGLASDEARQFWRTYDWDEEVAQD